MNKTIYVQQAKNSLDSSLHVTIQFTRNFVFSRAASISLSPRKDYINANQSTARYAHTTNILHALQSLVFVIILYIENASEKI